MQQLCSDKGDQLSKFGGDRGKGRRACCSSSGGGGGGGRELALPQLTLLLYTPTDVHFLFAHYSGSSHDTK